MYVLGFKGIKALKKEVLRQQIIHLANKNGIHNVGKIKIIVWRKEGGKYTPDNRHFNILIIIRKIEKPDNFSSIRLSFSETVHVQYSKFSAFKTCNALPYILSGIEAENRKVDDLILLDNQGNIAECNYSNIFWVKNNEVFTPSIKTGCVAGVFRKNIINILKKENFIVKEVKSNRKEVLKANYVFISNVMQVRHVYRIDKKRFGKFTIIEKLLNREQ